MLRSQRKYNSPYSCSSHNLLFQVHYFGIISTLNTVESPVVYVGKMVHWSKLHFWVVTM